MRRYVRLYSAFLRFSFSRAMQFRLDFGFRIVMDCCYYAMNLLFFTILYRHTAVLGGWSLDQVYVFICGFLLVDAVYMTFFSTNFWMLPQFINRGDLDYYLVRPVSAMFFLTLREFAANSFMNLIIAIGLLTWALLRYPGPLGAGSIAVYVLLLLVGCVCYYYLHLGFLIPVFWIHSEHGLAELFHQVARLAERPHQIYGTVLRYTVMSILPVGLMASLPAHALFGGQRWELCLHAVGVTGVLAAFVTWLWGRGLRSYSSASS